MKNGKKVEQLGLQPKYYYKYALDGDAGRVTVAVAQLHDGKYVRGIAYCDPRDQFRKAKGRAIALGHLLQALEHGENVAPTPKKIRRDWMDAPVYMGEFNTVPNNLERDLTKPQNRIHARLIKTQRVTCPNCDEEFTVEVEE